MSFLFPLYFLGAAALAVPILLHLRRRPPKEHLEFGSLMFLEKSPERLTRRTRLEQLLLLALRCLALLLLAFAFARPFLESVGLDSEASALRRAVILVDRSASMRRSDLWDRARAAAGAAAARYGEGAEVALALYDERFDLVADLSALSGLGPEARAAAVEERLVEAAPQASWLGTDLGGALAQAANLLLSADATQAADSREIVLIGDFQEGADRDGLRLNPWPEEVALRCVALVPEERGNLSLSLAATPPRANVDEDEIYRVRVSNSAHSPSSRATLEWKGHPETRIETLVAPGTARILRSAPRPGGAERGTLVVVGDSHDFDNEVHVAPVQPRPLRVRFLGSEADAERAGSPLFYLKRALQPTPTLQPLVSAVATVEGLVPDEAEIVVAAGDWSPAEGGAMRRFAEAGGLVLAIVSAETRGEAFAELTGEASWVLAAAKEKGDDFALLADLDFAHPVLEPFARAQIRDFTKIRFWRPRSLSLGEGPRSAGTRVLATFDGESPALLEHRIGGGAVFAFLAGWRPEESQLALSSKFVPLLFSIFDHAGYRIRSAPTVYVGESGRPAPGFYEETAPDGSTRLASVNLAPAEGRTDAFDPLVEFAALGIPLAEADEAAEVELSAAQRLQVEAERKEAKQKLWKWLVFAALVVLIAETWLAGKRAGSTFKVSGFKLGPESGT